MATTLKRIKSATDDIRKYNKKQNKNRVFSSVGRLSHYVPTKKDIEGKLFSTYNLFYKKYQTTRF